jgi:hypothetical protein
MGAVCSHHQSTTEKSLKGICLEPNHTQYCIQENAQQQAPTSQGTGFSEIVGAKKRFENIISECGGGNFNGRIINGFHRFPNSRRPTPWASEIQCAGRHHQDLVGRNNE